MTVSSASPRRSTGPTSACLGEGAARGRVQDLPFSWEDSKLKFLKKIHSNNWSSYSGKVKVEFEIQIVESDCLAAENFASSLANTFVFCLSFFKKSESSLFFMVLSTKLLSNLFASLRCFKFYNRPVRFASLI